MKTLPTSARLALAIGILQPLLLSAETVHYAYDEAGRLIGAQFADGSSMTYLYDATGNLLRRTIAAFVDSDGNGIDDDWESLHFTAVGIDPDNDADGDGQNNLHEFFAGTLPNDPDDVLRVSEVGGADGAGFRIEWVAVPGRIYRVQYTDTLLPHDWIDLAGDVVAEDSNAFRTDENVNGVPRRFYRVVVIQ